MPACLPTGRCLSALSCVVTELLTVGRGGGRRRGEGSGKGTAGGQTVETRGGGACVEVLLLSSKSQARVGRNGAGSAARWHVRLAADADAATLGGDGGRATREGMLCVLCMLCACCACYVRCACCLRVCACSLRGPLGLDWNAVVVGASPACRGRAPLAQQLAGMHGRHQLARAT